MLGYLISDCGYRRIANPYSRTIKKFYIVPSWYENEFALGNTICKLQLINTGFEIRASRRNHNFKVKGYTTSRNHVILLSRKWELFSSSKMFVEKMYINRCYCGYDSEMKAFFIIDYGSSGEGSTNSTFVKKNKR